MKINSISSSGIYARNAIAMKARKSDEAILRDFKNFMKENGFVLNATLSPRDKGFYYTIELSKNRGYELTPVTDEDGYGVNASGKTLNEAILGMAKDYSGRDVYNVTSTSSFKLPKCI